jgi:hypothetical protein
VALLVKRRYLSALSTPTSSFPLLGILLQDPDHFQIERALILPGKLFEVLFQVGRKPDAVPCILVFHVSIIA